LNEGIAQLLVESGRARLLSELFEVREYPKEIVDFYAQSYSLALFLVHEPPGGFYRMINFLVESLKIGTEGSLKKFYGFPNVQTLEDRWRAWVLGSGPATIRVRIKTEER
jgi:hypothetical protein